MMENSSYIKPYFYIEGEKVIYPASTWKRVGARFIDIFLINIFVLLFFSILYSNIGNFGIPAEIINENYDEFVPPLYSLPFMLTTSFAILVLIVLNLIIPLINKKNPGQTLGKFIFSIAPIFFSDHNKKSIIIRELPLTIIVVMPLVTLLIMGGNPNFYYSQAHIFVENGGTIILNGKSIINDNINDLTFYSFVSDYMTIEENMPNGVALSGVAAAFIYLSQISLGIFCIFLIVLLISIAFNHQKMGLMDKIANTSIVDLKKIIDRSLIEGDPNYIEDTTLNPKEVSSSEGPPIELNK